MNAPKQAIVFSGGGAYAAYEVGVLKGLAESGWAGPQIVSGVSAGAFNAALLAESRETDLRRAAQQLEDVWVNRIPGNVFQVRADPRPLLGFGHGPYLQAAERWFSDIQSVSMDFAARMLRLGPVGPFDERLLQLVDLASLISVAPLEQLLRKIIDAKKLRESPLKLSVMATNWQTGQAEVFRNDKMTDAEAVSIILASAAIPGFFPQREVGGGVYVDGGLVMNTPLQPAIEDGADELRVIYLDPDIAKIPLLKMQNTFDTLDRVMAINMAFHINSDVENARRINRAIELFDGPATNIPQEKKSDLAALADRWERARSDRPPRKLTIHCYHPGRDLGGLLGLLRFEKSSIEELIRQGYKDAKEHNCDDNHCERAVGVGQGAD
jgi:NTE family protein